MPSSLKVEAIQEVGLSEQEEEITESIKSKVSQPLYIKVASFLTTLEAIRYMFHNKLYNEFREMEQFSLLFSIT